MTRNCPADLEVFALENDTKVRGAYLQDAIF